MLVDKKRTKLGPRHKIRSQTRIKIIIAITVACEKRIKIIIAKKG
jgi:hypothetical protein